MSPARLSRRQFCKRAAVGLATIPLVSILASSRPASSTQKAPPQGPAAYSLQCQDFRLVFDAASHLLECRHLPTNVALPVGGDACNWAHAGTTESDYVQQTTAVDVSPGVRDLLFDYGRGLRSRLRVTAHAHDLEFELLDVVGDCGSIRVFSATFLGLRDFNQVYGLDPLLDLGHGYFAGLVCANVQTDLFKYRDISAGWEQIGATSPADLPLPTHYARGQKFAFFICREAELRSRLVELEQRYGLPFGMSIKDRPENNVDYLFLLDDEGASSQDIVDLCQQTGLGNVNLFADIWYDQADSSAPFALRPRAKRLAADLHAAGLLVGAHCLVHAVPASGYYATHYPEQVSSTVSEDFRCYTFDNNLPETMAGDLAARVKELGIDWLYLDGAEYLFEDHGQRTVDLDWYARTRISGAILRALRAEGVAPVIHQQSSQGAGCYHFVSRSGQIDYWDGYPQAHDTPIRSMDEIAQHVAPHLRRAFVTPDLGWFGRRIHVAGALRDRDATWAEWQHICQASLQHNIPLGIRTTYSDFVTDPLHDAIVPLLRWTTRQRRQRFAGR